MKLLDTNIFIYAQGGPHRYFGACRALVSRLGPDSSSFTIDTELLREVLHVYILRGERARAFRTFDRLMSLFPQPVPLAADEALLARQILERYPSLSPRDAIHAAVVSTHHLEGIVTADAAFGQVQGLTVFNPLSMESEIS
ncbi:MAG: type II toxin-antitoxin system VapC family toxin [Chloroflexi bacterium]|nr:type II toxin-antitoxin system VapC family toxin [Chloroflexota bacterium]